MLGVWNPATLTVGATAIRQVPFTTLGTVRIGERGFGGCSVAALPWGKELAARDGRLLLDARCWLAGGSAGRLGAGIVVQYGAPGDCGGGAVQGRGGRLVEAGVATADLGPSVPVSTMAGSWYSEEVSPPPIPPPMLIMAAVG